MIKGNCLNLKLCAIALFSVWLTLVPGTTAFAGLAIVPNFDSSITSDPNAAVIEGTINWAIALYEARFADPITLTITFQEMSSGLGQSEWSYYTFSYSDVYSALVADATTVNDTNALLTLFAGPNNPVTGDAEIFIKSANLKALGFTGYSSGLPGDVDGIIGLNTSLMNLTRPGGSGSKYDLMAVAEHEIDEVMGLGSALDFAGTDPLPEDLFRYTTNGVLTFTTNGDAYFSLNSTTLLSRFNQTPGADRGDWWSTGAHTPQVQDAFFTPGATPNPWVELIALDVIGYDLLPPPRPVIQSVTRTGGTLHLVWSALGGLSYRVQYNTNLLHTNWINLGSAIVATNTTASATDPAASGPQRFYRVVSLQ